MIIIGEKINGAIPSVKDAIARRDEEAIATLASRQADAGADFIDCCASVEAAREYEVMAWLVSVIKSAAPGAKISLDSPDEKILAKALEEGLADVPGLINSVNEEGTKCETIFPLIAGTPWQVVGICCDENGIPPDVARKVDIAKRIIDKAAKYGVEISNLHIDPAVMALATFPQAMLDFEECITRIKEYAPQAKITGAISNISFEMPYRRAVNAAAMALAIRAGLDSAILDPLNSEMMAAVYAAEALSGRDKAGRKYNRAYRQHKFGNK